MIYFIQRDSDECITIGSSENVQEVIFSLQAKVGKVKLLGIQSGNETDVLRLQQRFQKDRLENNNDWFIDTTELEDYIDETASSPDDSGIDSSTKYKSSDYTPRKQQSLLNALEQQINLVVHITEKWTGVKPYLYFDLNAGPGITQDNQPGSPIIFQRVANEYAQKWQKFRFEGTLYEADLQTYSELLKNIGTDARFNVSHASHIALAEELDKRAKLPEKERKWVYGTIYADPSNADLPWDILERANEVYPRIDVMINIACASYKRTIASVGYKTLAERLPRIKDHWLVRKPYGRFQWSILIGTNWTQYPAWEKKFFYPWNDNGIGSAIFEKLVYTQGQIKKLTQPRLFE